MGSRTTAQLSGGKILLTYASMRGEEEELSDQGETFKVQRSNPVRTYSHWILRDLVCHHIKEENASPPFLSTLLLSLKTEERCLRASVGCELLS